MLLPDYAGLQIFWWLMLGGFVAVVGTLLAGELGLSVLLRFVARDEDERRALLAGYRSPVSGQAVWLMLLGGAVVGAWWPLFHASLFSGLWLVLLFILIALLVGPVGHSYRDVVPAKRLTLWDNAWTFLSVAALLVLGIGVGTIISGVPMHYNADMSPVWAGFFARFTPYEVLVPGLMVVLLGVFLAAARTAVVAEGELARRARKLLIPTGGLAFLDFVGGAIWGTQITGYAIGYTTSMEALTNPVKGTVVPVWGAYLEQYLGQYPMTAATGSWPLLLVPIFAGLSLLAALFFAWRGRLKLVWPIGCMAVAGLVATAGTTTYPIILPSFTMPARSITVWNGTMPFQVLVAYLVWLGVLIPAALGYEVWARRHGVGMGGRAASDS